MTKLLRELPAKICFVLVTLAFAIGLGDVLLPAAAAAEPAPKWLLSDTTGQVRLVKSGVTPVALTVGDIFAEGDWIETGPDGRAILRRGSETIVIAPNSRIGLPEKNNGLFLTRILQTLGTILLTVDKKASQHFEVQTPYMAAVVKGTTFTVGIQGQRAVVHVVEGLVEVRNLTSGLSSMVRPGQTGSVLRGGGAGVNVEGARENTGAASPSNQTGIPAQNNADSQVAASGTGIPAVATAAPAEAASVTVTDALGPRDVDLAGATAGLIRESTSDSAPGTNAGAKADGPSSVASVSGVAAAPLSMPNELATTLVLNSGSSLGSAGAISSPQVAPGAVAIPPPPVVACVSIFGC